MSCTITRTVYDRYGQIHIVEEVVDRRPWFPKGPTPDELFAANEANYCCHILLPLAGKCDVCGKQHKVRR